MKKKIALLIACISVICLAMLTGCTEQVQYAEDAVAAEYKERTDAIFQELFAMTNEEIAQQLAFYTEIEDSTYVSMYQAWTNVYSDLGDYKEEIVDYSVYESDDSGVYAKSYVCEITYGFSKRNLNVKVIYDIEQEGEEAPITSISLEGQYTLGEKMQTAALNTVIGMGTVFIVLILITFIISMFGWIAQIFNKKAEMKKAAPEPVREAEPAVTEEEIQELADEDEGEIAAVIAAAIAAYEAETNSSADGLVVRSIRRAEHSKWRKA